MSQAKIIALTGNPNVGKSTIFNALTGLNQHTGNWSGKTVDLAQGILRIEQEEFILVDLPGTYSLMANSTEEKIARDFLCFQKPDLTIIVIDATCLERNLNLVLQTLEITDKVIICVNLLDEANKKGIQIDLDILADKLGVPVIGTSASKNQGLDKLKASVSKAVKSSETNSVKPLIIYNDDIEQSVKALEAVLEPIINNKLPLRWVTLKLLDSDPVFIDSINTHLGINLQKSVKNVKPEIQKNFSPDKLREIIVSQIINTAENIAKSCVRHLSQESDILDRKIDKYLTSPLYGIPIMLCLLAVIFWLTIVGANYPSALLSNSLFGIEKYLSNLCMFLHTPDWLHGLLILGIYRTVAWVISVMLPPMVIFFPLFTLLEDLGYLPRIAFNLDHFFKKASTCGKQALTMCMGFGCNAAGVIGCRIIDSPRERLIAILTNNFVPCNGRFPTLISIIMMFFTGLAATITSQILSALLLTGIILLGIILTLLSSVFLSKTLLKGIPSSFILELPPYRKPQIIKVIIRSILDRTLFVLYRAVYVSVPAGALIWILANTNYNSASLLTHCAQFLDPFAYLIGLDGYILLAFVLGFPANEIVIPIIIMSYLASGNLTELDSLKSMQQLFINHGWTSLTAICVMLFSLVHWPCSTTCLTIRKETGSWKWTLVSILLPTLLGFILCFLTATVGRLIIQI